MEVLVLGLPKDEFMDVIRIWFELDRDMNRSLDAMDLELLRREERPSSWPLTLDDYSSLVEQSRALAVALDKLMAAVAKYNREEKTGRR